MRSGILTMLNCKESVPWWVLLSIKCQIRNTWITQGYNLMQLCKEKLFLWDTERFDGEMFRPFSPGVEFWKFWKQVVLLHLNACICQLERLGAFFFSDCLLIRLSTWSAFDHDSWFNIPSDEIKVDATGLNYLRPFRFIYNQW